MCIRVNLQNNAVDSQKHRNCMVQQQHNATQGMQAKWNKSDAWRAFGFIPL
jgi:hypothetical protein